MKRNISKEKILVTIAVPTYMAELNVEKLIKSLLDQKVSSHIHMQILIHDDNSSDKTVSTINKFEKKNLTIYVSKKRIGFTRAVKNILKLSKLSHVLVIINDDVLVRDKRFIEKMVKPILSNESVGLVGGNVKPLPPKSFIERAINTSSRAYEKMREEYKDGNNKYTCDGKALAISKKFADSLTIPDDPKKAGNLDVYLYFACLKNNFEYKHAKDAVVYYRNPSTLHDYMKWFIRNNSNRHILKDEFGELVDREYKTPSKLIYYKFVEFVKSPVETIFIFLTGFYIRHKAKSHAKIFNETWSVIGSSKNLDTV